MKNLDERNAVLNIPPETFRKMGHGLVDELADFYATLMTRKVTEAPTPRQIRELLGTGRLPETGTDPGKLLSDATDLVTEYSLHNGHPGFFGFITSSAAPIGALADLLCSAVNPNVGLFNLSPVATEIEAQTVRWISELIGYREDCGGILVSGGNMANFVCFLAARKAQIPWDVRTNGVAGEEQEIVRVYASSETHTWIQKAVDLAGFGTECLRWIPVDEELRMRTDVLAKQIEDDLSHGEIPLLVVGTAGSVGTGAVDPLEEIATICRKHKIWFHVDGAYGGFAAALRSVPKDLHKLKLADSVAVDPHKWLYAPLEAGCALVRDRELLREAFTFHPPYYAHGAAEEDQPLNMYEFGPQNSRGFRALKVWLGLRQAGREGYRDMIADDIRLAVELSNEVKKHEELEAVTQALSITTFRFVPRGIDTRNEQHREYLNELNTRLLQRIQDGGKVFLSNAIVNGAFVLRACVVNFRTRLSDIRGIPGIVLEAGRSLVKEFPVPS